jgi:hypothetical protein
VVFFGEQPGLDVAPPQSVVTTQLGLLPLFIGGLAAGRRGAGLSRQAYAGIQRTVHKRWMSARPVGENSTGTLLRSIETVCI